MHNYPLSKLITDLCTDTLRLHNRRTMSIQIAKGQYSISESTSIPNPDLLSLLGFQVLVVELHATSTRRVCAVAAASRIELEEDG